MRSCMLVLQRVKSRGRGSRPSSRASGTRTSLLLDWYFFLSQREQLSCLNELVRTQSQSISDFMTITIRISMRYYTITCCWFVDIATAHHDSHCCTNGNLLDEVGA